MATTRPIFLRSAIRLPAKTSTVRCASFHTSRYLAINVGDSLPDVELMEDSPGNKVNLSKEFAKDGGKGIVIGVPAAFSTYSVLKSSIVICDLPWNFKGKMKYFKGLVL
jgi:hypothetical protein